MLPLGDIPLRVSALLPALATSVLIGGAAYFSNAEIETFGHHAESDITAYVRSVPRDVTNLPEEFSDARTEMKHAAQRTAQQLSTAGREFHSFVADERYRRATLELHPSGGIKVALGFAIMGFLIAYLRLTRKPPTTQPRLKVF
ncbi:MAG: hypothetical protein KGN84_01735 [Acidobacteriota bacterium]|nr:hypothetical protein [Acidobacteriota bacterium]